MVISCTAAILNTINSEIPPRSVIYTKDGTGAVTKVIMMWGDFGPVAFDFGTTAKPTEAQVLGVYPAAHLAEAIVTP